MQLERDFKRIESKMKSNTTSILLTILIVFLCILPLRTPPSSSANEGKTYTNWPLARMDSSNSAFTTAKFPTTMEFDKFLSLHSHHSPIIANNCYYLMESYSGTLHCYDVSTQSFLWEKRYVEGPNQKDLFTGNTCAFSESTNQLLLLETAEGNWSDKTNFVSRVTALNPGNGDIYWQNEIEGYYANSIVVSDEEVFAKVIKIRSTSGISYDSKHLKIVCYNLQSGKTKWETQEIRGGDFYEISSPPSVNEKYLTVTSTNFDCKNDDEIAPRSRSFISLIDRTNGILLRTEQIYGCSEPGIPLLIEDKIFLTANSYDDSKLYLLEYTIKNDTLGAKKQFSISDYTNWGYFKIFISCNNNYLFFRDYTDSLVCFSIDKEKILWRKIIGGDGSYTPNFCNESYLIICIRKGISIALQFLSPEDGTELFSTSIPYTDYLPVDINGTDDHIWISCWSKDDKSIAHFTTPPPPTISVSPLELQDTCWEGETECFTHTLTVTTTGEIAGTIQCGDPWISTDTNRVTQNTNKVQVTIDPSSQSVGTHSSTITFDTNAGMVTVSVILTVLERPFLSIYPTSINLTIQEGKTPPSTLFHVSNTGGKGLQGTITEETNWLSLSDTTITDTLTEFTADYSTQSLSPGVYKGNIEATSNGGNQTIPITITVIPKPHLVVTPSEIIKQVAIGSYESEVLTLTNIGGPGLQGTIASDQEWLQPSIDIYKDTTKTMSVVLNARDLQAGTYYGTITFTGNDQIITVPVTLQCIVWITFQIGSRTVEVNKHKETIEAAPYLFQKRSYVPVRKLVESLPVLKYLKDAEMKWNPEERKVTILLHDKTIELWVDNPMAQINNKDVPIDPDNTNIAPQIREGRTFLPLRFVSETLGYTVEWVASTQTIHIKYIVGEEE